MSSFMVDFIMQTLLSKDVLYTPLKVSRHFMSLAPIPSFILISGFLWVQLYHGGAIQPVCQAVDPPERDADPPESNADLWKPLPAGLG